MKEFLLGKASRRLDPTTGMNKTEARYADLLELDLREGKILRWDFEPETFMLADDTRYTPDFRVIRPDGIVEFHEIKGGFRREDAWVKFKIAAALHPYIFKLCVYKGKQWVITEAGNKKAC